MTSTREPTAPARCSRAEAVALAKELHLGNADYTPNPVRQVLCGPFLGAGSRAMVASLTTPGCGGTIGWVVFRIAGGAWQLVMKRNNGAELAAVGSDIKETTFVLRPGDAHCFPTGGTRARIWHWNGTRFVASAWKQVTTGTVDTPAAQGGGSGYFKTPSANIVCGYRIYTGSRAAESFVGCRIKSGLVPPPPGTKPGCFSRNEIAVRATGRTMTGPSICPGEPEGDAGVFAFESLARVLGYGKSWRGGGIRCASAFTGLTCRNKSRHGFFLSRDRWRSF